MIPEEIPEGVVNRKEWMKYIVYKNNPILMHPIMKDSNGEDINIATLPHRLRKRIEHLNPQEQDMFIELKAKWNKFSCLRNVAKSSAFGKQGRVESRVSRLVPFEEDIKELLGKMFTIPEVVRIMGEDNGIACTEDDVKLVLKTRITEIERQREAFRNKIADVRLYNKRPRLDELTWMYNQMRTKYCLVRSVDTYNCMLRTLEQIRKEAEGDILNIKGALDVNIEVEIQSHLQKEIMQTINLKEIILGRVAARMNWDTKKLVAGLHNSYYAKFVNISGDFEEGTEMSYPSASNYDFTQIEKAASSTPIDIEAVDVTEAEKSTANGIKDIFLSKIRQQKKDIEDRNNKIAAEVEIKAKKVKNDVDEKPLRRRENPHQAKKLNSKKRKKSNIKNIDYKTGAKLKK